MDEFVCFHSGVNLASGAGGRTARLAIFDIFNCRWERIGKVNMELDILDIEKASRIKRLAVSMECRRKEDNKLRKEVFAS